MTVPPNSITFLRQYKATLPLPDMITFLPSIPVFLYCLSASSAKYVTPYPVASFLHKEPPKSRGFPVKEQSDFLEYNLYFD